MSSYEQDFELTYTHNSTAIEGNTLTLIETKVVLEDGISVGGKKLREIYEVVNHKKAYRYVKKCIAEEKKLDEHIVKDLHAILTENIIVGGVYRSEPVRISGAGHTPPVGNDMYIQIKNFYEDLASITPPKSPTIGEACKEARNSVPCFFASLIDYSAVCYGRIT